MVVLINIQIKLGQAFTKHTVQERVSNNYNFKVKTVYRYSGCIYGRAVQLQEGVTTNYIFKVKTVYRYPGCIYMDEQYKA